jgi:hypothetical protein
MGLVGFLKFSEPCAVESAACDAALNMGVLAIGDRVYDIQVNTILH